MTKAYEIIDHKYGGSRRSGWLKFRATLGMAAAGLKTACITKVFPTRGRTLWRHRVGYQRRSGTWLRTTGNGTCMTQ